MEYGKLGNTDIEVSKLCVGCMSFGKAGTMHDWTLDEAESENVIKHALDLGYNFFDTANGYSAGTSEEYLGKALKKNVARNQVVIASKVYFNEGRLSRQAIMREIDGTLSRLGTDYLDLYIIHRFDYDTPIEETMEGLQAQPGMADGKSMPKTGPAGCGRFLSAALIASDRYEDLSRSSRIFSYFLKDL